MSNYFAFKAAAAAGSGGYFSTGTIIPWPKASILTGFLRCDGTAVSRTTYADLFAVIGTSYGAGDGASTFNIPNLQGKIPLGDDGSNFNIGSSGGANTSTPNIVFGSSTVDVTSNDDFAVSVNIASADVPLPAHTHFTVHDNASVNAAANDVTSNTPIAQTRNIGTNTSSFRYDLAGVVATADVGLTSTAGSGSGTHNHNHNANLNGSVTSSFNQSNLSANSNAVDVLQPYVVCRFLIKT